MTLHLGMVMDPISQIKVHKDSSFAMLLAAQARGWQLGYLEMSDLSLRDGRLWLSSRSLTVRDDAEDWYTLGEPALRPAADFDFLLMRKDPPFDREYLMATHLLERAEADGVRVVNSPRGLRDYNEKLATARFPQCCAPVLVDRDMDRLRAFIDEHEQVIIKPLDAMGGASIFRVNKGDANTGVILETMTENGNRYCMAQQYIPAIARGDKRILLIDGKPVPYALARIPTGDDHRGNLAAGGRAEGMELTERDSWICEQIAPALREAGLPFVGIDVIGDYLTEINVTSPTCIRELDAIYGLDIAGDLMDVLAGDT